MTPNTENFEAHSNILDRCLGNLVRLSGEGDKKLFVCKCGYRERLSDFNKRKQDSGANKFDVMNYMKKQQKEEKGKPDNNPMADLLKDFF